MSEPNHVPPQDRTSFWERDPILRRAVRRALPPEVYQAEEETFRALGAAAADEIDRLGALADRHGPVHVPRDPSGQRIDRIDYHPAYRRLEELAYGEFRLVGAKYDPELRAKGVAHRVGFSRTLQFGMGESGVLCPVCMTDGVARVIEQSGDKALIELFIPKLCWGKGEARNTGAMFLTEKAGGSDVGRVETSAVHTGEAWELLDDDQKRRTSTFAKRIGEAWNLTGEKWFSSNVDAELILALGRPVDAVAGTRGLGLFLVERAKQTADTLRIERIKEKMGTRVMPTGEVLLDGAPSIQVGPIDAGFKQMTAMLNLSRLYNAVVSCALIGRSWLEARSFAERRVTFGKPVAEHPLAAEVLGQMEAEYAGSLALVFETMKAIDEADGGDEAAGDLLRGMTPLIKLFTGKVAVAMASEGLEFLGGCGYCDDWPMPRIFRDAQVLPIWEGTTNILSLDLVRVARKGELKSVFARGQAALDASTHAALAPAREAAEANLAAALEGFTALAGGANPAPARALAFRLARGLQVALLAEAGDGEPDGPEARAALRLASLQRGPCV